MKINGRIQNIIPPEKHKEYNFSKKLRQSVEGKFCLLIIEADCPCKGILAYWRWAWNHKRWVRSWKIATSECPWKKGDIVSLEVVPLLPMVEYWELPKR